MNDTKQLNSSDWENELDAALEPRIKPLEQIGAVKRVVVAGKKKWATAGDIKKLAALIAFANSSNGTPDTVIINGKSVLLTLPILMNVFILLNNEEDEEVAQKLDNLFEEKKKSMKF